LPSLPYVFLAVYALLNLCFLERFPFVHSNESWLSGLSRSIFLSHDFAATEPFFDLKDRYPHAIKLIFHGMQIVVIKLLGYNIFSMRLLSLVFGVLSLYLIYKLALLLWGKQAAALGALVFCAVDIQFVYASHLARQEIILVFCLLLSLYFFYKYLPRPGLGADLLSGSVIGLSIGVHPNSFIIFLPALVLYVYHVLISKRLPWVSLLRYLTAVSCFAFAFIGLSLFLDPQFLNHYSALGESLAVFNPLPSKLTGLKLFYQKLYYSISGTYYTPWIRFQFYLFGAIFLGALGLAWLQRNEKGPARDKSCPAAAEITLGLIFAILALNLGIVLVGRFNQTSVIFQFPLFYLLAASLIYTLPDVKTLWRHLAAGLLTLVLLSSSMLNIFPALVHSYDDYLRQIEKYVPAGARVLANLNTEYYFSPGKLYDYRNLAFLPDKGLDFDEYIRGNDIEYIIYPEEMDVIHQERPRWNGMYGPLLYYEEMQAFLKDHCRLAGQFSAPVYGMRIVGYQNIRDWQVKIYRVNTL
ncbi:MAG: glycosyltransferase family 39 protein, partial [Clostridia bacterium]|nr:glycosyltransferase family 39 protein [Clostridia bacterium]